MVGSVGRLERSHPLEFPMGIGGLRDEERDDEQSRLRPVPARAWAQTGDGGAARHSALRIQQVVAFSERRCTTMA